MRSFPTTGKQSALGAAIRQTAGVGRTEWQVLGRPGEMTSPGRAQQPIHGQVPRSQSPAAAQISHRRAPWPLEASVAFQKRCPPRHSSLAWTVAVWWHPFPQPVRSTTKSQPLLLLQYSPTIVILIACTDATSAACCKCMKPVLFCPGLSIRYGS